MAILILGIILFLGLHLLRVVAPDFRAGMVDKFGENGWKGIYSIVSIVSIVVLIYGWASSPTINLWFPPMGMSHLTVTLMLFAMICLAAAELPAGHIATKTKHPMILGIKIWAFSHLLANGDLASVLLFGSFLAWGVILRIALKRRERAGLIAPRPFVSAKYDLIAIGVGALIWALFVWKLHEWLIGVAPIPM